MRIGSTPTHVFDLPIDTSTITNLKITYSQHNKEILHKYMEDCILSSNSVRVTLSQEDTLLFDPDVYVSIQIKVVTIGGAVIPSDIMRRPCYECLDREVLL